jgi:hypothetical protein
MAPVGRAVLLVQAAIPMAGRVATRPDWAPAAVVAPQQAVPGALAARTRPAASAELAVMARA